MTPLPILRRELRVALCVPAFLLVACAPAAAQCIRYEDYTHPVGILHLGEMLFGAAVSGRAAYVTDFSYDMTTRFHAIDVADPTRPTLAGTLQLPGQYPCEGIAVLGRHAFLASWYEGEFFVVDVADPRSPLLVAARSIPGLADVAASGSHVYLTGNAFHVLDVSDPSDPRIVATLDIACGGIAVAGRYAYVGGYEEGLLVVDIADPLHPAVVASLPVAGEAWLVSASGSRAYFIEHDGWQDRLHVVDIADPLHPVLRGNLVGGAYSMTALNDAVYLSYPWEGLCVVDAVDPENPVVAEVLELPTWYATRVAVDASPLATGSRIFVSGISSFDMMGYAGWFTVFDLTPIQQVSPLGALDVSCPPHGLAVSGSLAYIAEGGCGLRVVDVADPHAPVSVSLLDTPDAAHSVAVTGKLAVVADGYSGVQVVDVSNPQAPWILGHVDTPGAAGAVRTRGHLAFVADGDAGLHVVDIADPAHPRIIGTAATPDAAQGVAISGDHAYVAACMSGLQVIDVSDPTEPRIVGAVDLEWNCIGVDVSGDYAYAAVGQTGLHVIDVSDPAAPRVVGTLQRPPWSWANDVAVVNKDVYLGAGTAVYLVDVSDPEVPRYKGRFGLPRDVYALHVSGPILFVTEGDGCQDRYRFLAAPAQCQPIVGPGIRGSLTGTLSATAEAWPNPMTSGATVRLGLPPGPGSARACVWDVGGRLVRTLLHGRPGAAEISWDGRDASGRPVPAGIYWIRIEGGGAHRLVVLP